MKLSNYFFIIQLLCCFFIEVLQNQHSILLAITCAETVEPFDTLIKKAEEFSQKQVHQKAVEYYQLALTAYPNQRRLILIPYANELAYNSQSPLAIPIYREILSTNPTQNELEKATQGLAQALVWTGKYQDALDLYINILQRDPINQFGLTGKSFILIEIAKDAAKNGNSQESAKYFHLAIQANPTKRQELLPEYALQLAKSGKADAIPLFRELLTLPLSKSENDEITKNLATALVWNGKYEEAIELYKIHLTKFPDDPIAKKNQASLLIEIVKYAIKHKNYDIASNYLKQAIEVNPEKKDEIQFIYAHALTKEGQADAAIPVYRIILEKGTSCQEIEKARKGLAFALISQGKYQESVQLYDDYLQKHPHDQIVIKDKADIILEIGKEAYARQEFQNVSNLSLLNLRYLQDRIEYANQLSYTQASAAVQIYQEILASNPPHELYLKTIEGLARAYVWTGNYLSALKLYQQALQKAPDDESLKKGEIDIVQQIANHAANKNLYHVSLDFFHFLFALNPESKKYQLLPFAEQLSHSGKPDQAIPLYEEILAANPSNEVKERVIFDIAQAYVWLGEYKKAIQMYDDILNYQPDDKNALAKKNEILIEIGKDVLRRQQPFVLDYSDEKISTIKDRLDYAETFSALGKAHVAVPIFREIWKTVSDPDLSRRAFIGLSQSLVWSGQYDEALKLYDELLEKNPNDKDILKGRSATLLLIEDHKKNKETDPKQKALSLIELAKTASIQGKNRESADLYQQAFNLDSNLKKEWLTEYGKQLSYSGQHALAIPIFKELIKENPKKEDLRPIEILLAKSYLWTNQNQEALNSFEAILKLDSHSEEAKKGKALTLIEVAKKEAQNKKFKEAAGLIKQAMDLDPEKRSDWLKDYADQLAYSGQNKEAIPFYRELLTKKLDENQAYHVHAGLARALFWTEDYKESLEQFNLALALNHSDESVWKDKEEALKKYHTKLSEIEFKKGEELENKLEIFKAKIAFENALKLDPDNKGHYEAYTWFLNKYGFYEEAIPFLYQMAIIKPENARIYWQTIGWDSKSLGQLYEALLNFQKVFYIPCHYTIKNAMNQVAFDQARENRQNIKEAKNKLCWDYTPENEKDLFYKYIYASEWNTARRYGNYLISKYPNDLYLRLTYVKVLSQLNDDPNTLLQYFELIEQSPQSSYAYYKLAEFYENNHQLENALEALEKANAIDENIYISRALARVLARTGNKEEALNLAEDIQKHIHSNPLTAELALAEAQLYTGELNEATLHFRNILADYPYNQDAVWGLMVASNDTHETSDTRLAYRQWTINGFDDYERNLLVDFYKPPQQNSGLSYFENSNLFRRTDIGTDYNFYQREKIRMDMGYIGTRFSQSHFKTINRNHLFIDGRIYFSPKKQLSVRFIENFYNKIHSSLCPTSFTPEGVPIIDISKRHSKNSFNYYLTYKIAFNRKLTATLAYEHYDIIDTEPPLGNPIYNYVVQIGAVALNIKTKDFHGTLFYQLNDHTFLFGSIAYGKYSDHNTKQTRTFSLIYQLPTFPSVRISYNYFYLNFLKRASLVTEDGVNVDSAYFDPINFELHTVNLFGEFEITSSLRAGIESALIYLPKANDAGNSFFVFLNYQFCNNLAMRIDGRYFHLNKGVIRTGLSPRYNAYNANIVVNYQY